MPCLKPRQQDRHQLWFQIFLILSSHIAHRAGGGGALETVRLHIAIQCVTSTVKFLDWKIQKLGIKIKNSKHMTFAVSAHFNN